MIVAAGLLGGILARLLRLPLLVGYVAAGVFVGPNTAGPTVGQIHDIELLAEIGVALLLFSLGLEISFRDLGPVRRVALLGGPVQILGTCALAALAAQRFLAMPWGEAVWFGAMVSVSSTMVVLKTLSAGGVINTLASRVMIGLLVIQDLAVIPMLIVLPRLNAPGDELLPVLARSLGIAAASLAGVWLVGTRLLPVFLKLVLSWKSRELFLVSVVATGVGVGYAAHAIGMSFALGAFVAGLVLSESEFSHQALSDVVPLRDVFGLLFFVTVGMLFDPRFALAHAGTILIAILSIFLGKSLLIGLLSRAFGYQYMAPWIIGLGLAQIGEFSFVLVRTGLASGQLSKATYDLVLTCTVLTMALAPLVSSAALPLGRAWRSWRRPPQEPAKRFDPPAQPLSGHVIIAGFGRTGRTVARALHAAGIPVLVIELNHAILPGITAAGYNAIWGDATSAEILHAAQVETARLLLLATPDQSTSRLAIQRARQLNPHLVLIARATWEHQIAELRALGAAAAIQPEFEGGLEMVRQSLNQCGQNEQASLAIVERLRAELYANAS